MTYDQLDALGIDHKWLAPLEETFAKYDISTPLRKAAFIGQCQHESNNFKTLEENLHYSAHGLMATWPSRFPSADVADQFANNPEKIANKVYGGRMGNGNESSGDGYKYSGRGAIQLTGKQNYTLFDDFVPEAIIETPSLVATKYPLLSAAWFWSRNGLNAIADLGATDDVITKITKKVNGGTHGLEDRIAKFKKFYPILK